MNLVLLIYYNVPSNNNKNHNYLYLFIKIEKLVSTKPLKIFLLIFPLVSKLFDPP